jgi:hypothetical protein
VIELGRLPRRSGVTALASRAQLTHMHIVLLVAGKTVHRGTFVSRIPVTLFTGHLYVGARQFEQRTVMVKAGGLPSVGRMARRAVGSQAPLMWISWRVTGETVLRRGLQGGEGPLPDMAL